MAARTLVGRHCKDCPPGTKRPAPHPGPRCATHHRLVRTKRRQTAHGKHVLDTFKITEDQYWQIYELQGGKCYICRRATGRAKRLAVDHDHKCCPGPTSCGKCVRGLCCGRCNVLLGHLRDDISAFQRAIEYLTDPPARRVLS